MSQIIYESRGGNTRKLAEAMAKELGVKAEDAKTASLSRDTDTLFLGSGCYGGKPGENMGKLIEANDFQGRRVALFGTSGGGKGLETEAMAEALRGKGATVVGKFHCGGQFLLFFSRGHPDDADLAAARQFAREMARLR